MVHSMVSMHVDTCVWCGAQSTGASRQNSGAHMNPQGPYTSHIACPGPTQINGGPSLRWEVDTGSQPYQEAICK